MHKEWLHIQVLYDEVKCYLCVCVCMHVHLCVHIGVGPNGGGGSSSSNVNVCTVVKNKWTAELPKLTYLMVYNPKG